MKHKSRLQNEKEAAAALAQAGLATTNVAPKKANTPAAFEGQVQSHLTWLLYCTLGQQSDFRPACCVKPHFHLQLFYVLSLGVCMPDCLLWVVVSGLPLLPRLYVFKNAVTWQKSLPSSMCGTQGLDAMKVHKSRLERERDEVAMRRAAGPGAVENKPLPSYMRATKASIAMKVRTSPSTPCTIGRCASCSHVGLRTACVAFSVDAKGTGCVPRWAVWGRT